MGPTEGEAALYRVRCRGGVATLCSLLQDFLTIKQLSFLKKILNSEVGARCAGLSVEEDLTVCDEEDACHVGYVRGDDGGQEGASRHKEARVGAGECARVEIRFGPRPDMTFSTFPGILLLRHYPHSASLLVGFILTRFARQRGAVRNHILVQNVAGNVTFRPAGGQGVGGVGGWGA